MTDTKTESPMPLARAASADEVKALRHLLRRRQNTDERAMALKRRTVAAMTLQADNLLAQLDAAARGQVPEIPPNSPAFQEAMNLANLFSMRAMVASSEYLCDCSSYQEEVPIEMEDGSKRNGFVRLTVADVLNSVAEMLGGDGGVIASVRRIEHMLNDMGVKAEAFKDEHGVAQPDKYEDGLLPFDDDEEPAKTRAEGGAATEEELQEVEESVKKKMPAKGTK